MNTDLLKAYRAERASDRGGCLGMVRAADALRMARYNLANRGADFPRYCGDTITLDLPRGEHIEMKLEPDYDADIFERLDCGAECRAKTATLATIINSGGFPFIIISEHKA